MALADRKTNRFFGDEKPGIYIGAEAMAINMA